MTDIKTYNKRKLSKGKKGQRSRLVIVISIVVVVAVVAFAMMYFLFSGMAPSSAVVRIPAGATNAQLHDSISKYLGDGYAKKVTRLVGLRGTDLHQRHGAYLIEAGMSPFDAMRRLTGGAQEPLTITINGFRLLPVLEEKVSARFDFTQDSIAAALADPNLLKKYDLTPENALALFINDSYEFYWDASPEDVVNKVGAHYNDVWTSERKS